MSSLRLVSLSCTLAATAVLSGCGSEGKGQATPTSLTPTTSHTLSSHPDASHSISRGAISDAEASASIEASKRSASAKGSTSASSASSSASGSASGSKGGDKGSSNGGSTSGSNGSSSGGSKDSSSGGNNTDTSGSDASGGYNPKTSGPATSYGGVAASRKAVDSGYVAPRPNGSISGVPVAISIPAIGLRHSVGSISGNVLDPASGVIARYTGSAANTDVLVGHVTLDGPDVFYRLPALNRGDKITVTYAGGGSRTLTVTHKASIDKDSATSNQDIWNAHDAPTLVLVTCDASSRWAGGGHHVNNYVVWAS